MWLSYARILSNVDDGEKGFDDVGLGWIHKVIALLSLIYKEGQIRGLVGNNRIYWEDFWSKVATSQDMTL